jgi:hypothetical protein
MTKDFTRHVDYIHFNPVKHGYVAHIADRPYSSFHRFVRLGIYPAEWASDGAGRNGGFGERQGGRRAVALGPRFRGGDGDVEGESGSLQIGGLRFAYPP